MKKVVQAKNTLLHLTWTTAVRFFGRYQKTDKVLVLGKTIFLDTVSNPVGKQDFSTWIKNRISEYDFVENQDFVRFHKKMEANNATLIEYYITLDVATVLEISNANPSRFNLDEKGIHKMYTPTSGGAQEVKSEYR